MIKKILPAFLSFFVIIFVLTPFWQPVAHASSNRLLAQSSGINVGEGAVETEGTSPEPAAKWVQDDKVTFAGKLAVRSKDLLNWVIANYKWAELEQGAQNPLQAVFVTIRNITYGLLALSILVAAFLIIITRGQSITVRRFIPQFLGTLIILTLSFSIIQFLYQITDVIQVFFLKKPDGNFISVRDLLDIAFNYKEFVGYRLTGTANSESSFISLLLVYLTAFTYYVMFGILIVRKVILWFFIVVSPIFSLLLLFSPVRNTAKIWIGEFLRWLLYAPLFAIFLSGIVVMWHIYIPLKLDFTKVDNVQSIEYPTAINILLGGPNQNVKITNSVNLPDTFIQYVVALIMLWMVIIVPFILLKIFLDYLNSFSFNDSTLVKYLVNNSKMTLGGRSPYNPRPPAGGPGSPPPTGHLGGGAGAMIRLPIRDLASDARRPVGATHQISEAAINNAAINATTMAQTAGNQSAINSAVNQAINQQSVESALNQSNIVANVSSENLAQSAESLNQTAVNATNTTNVASTVLNRAEQSNAEANSIHLQSSLSNPSTISNVTNINQPTTVQNTNISSNVAASPEVASILKLENLPVPTMADIAKYETTILAHEMPNSLVAQSPAIANAPVYQVMESLQRIAGKSKIVTVQEQKKYEHVKTTLVSKSAAGDPVASAVMSASMGTQSAVIPTSNKVQSVNIAEYEQVKKIWQDNYSKMEPPASSSGTPQDKSEWLNQEVSHISQAVTLLQSSDPMQEKQGKEMVSKILPFLLLGGFSKQEIIAYLKAKQNAAVAVKEDTKKEEEDEGNKVEVGKKKEEEKHMADEAEENEDGDETAPINPAAADDLKDTKSPSPNQPSPDTNPPAPSESSDKQTG